MLPERERKETTGRMLLAAFPMQLNAKTVGKVDVDLSFYSPFFLAQYIHPEFPFCSTSLNTV